MGWWSSQDGLGCGLGGIIKRVHTKVAEKRVVIHTLKIKSVAMQLDDGVYQDIYDANFSNKLHYSVPQLLHYSVPQLLLQTVFF